MDFRRPQCLRKLWRPCRPEDLQKHWNWRSWKAIACLNSRNQCNSHKLLSVQQDLQMLHLPVQPLYCQPGAEDLQISRRLKPSGIAQGVWKFFSASAQSLKPKMFLSFIHLFKDFGFSAARSACTIFRRQGFAFHKATLEMGETMLKWNWLGLPRIHHVENMNMSTGTNMRSLSLMDMNDIPCTVYIQPWFTPDYFTAKRSHAENIWCMLNVAKSVFDIYNLRQR